MREAVLNGREMQFWRATACLGPRFAGQHVGHDVRDGNGEIVPNPRPPCPAFVPSHEVDRVGAIAFRRGVDLVGAGVEVDVAVDALGQGQRAIACPVGARDRMAAERAIDDQPQVLRFEIAAAPGADTKTELVDGTNGFAGDGGDGGFELRLCQGSLLSAVIRARTAAHPSAHAGRTAVRAGGCTGCLKTWGTRG